MAPTIPTLSVEAFGRKLRSGAIASRAVTEECLRRIHADIDAKNDGLNAFISVMADEARSHARLADEELARGIDRGPLHGVPISVKDLVDIQGLPTTAASRVREGHVARRDAAIIAVPELGAAPVRVPLGGKLVGAPRRRPPGEHE